MASTVPPRAGEPARRTRVHIVTGFLGAGKTTTLRGLLAQRPPGERWAVLVNELGEIGFDGDWLAEVGAGVAPGGAGVTIRELAGGCVCCSASVVMHGTVALLLRELRPDRLFVEPTGLAEPAVLVDMFRAPGLAEAVALAPVVGLVDPLQWTDARYRKHPTYAAQLEAADALLLARVERAEAREPGMVARVRRALARLDPPKLAVDVVDAGGPRLAWLDGLGARPALGPADAPARGATRGDGQRRASAGPVRRSAAGPLAHSGSAAPLRIAAPALVSAAPAAWREAARAASAASTHGAVARSWRFGPDAVFDGERLRAWLTAPAGLPGGWLRLKAIVRTAQGWRRVNATPGALDIRPTAHRRDQRLDAIASVAGVAGPPPRAAGPAEPADPRAAGIDWGAVERELRACLTRSS